MFYFYFSPVSGYAVKKMVKRTLSNRSSTESIDTSLALVDGSCKRFKLNDLSCVNVADLTIKIKRVARTEGKLGSKSVKFPVYTSSKEDIKRLGTPQKNYR